MFKSSAILVKIHSVCLPPVRRFLTLSWPEGGGGTIYSGQVVLFDFDAIMATNIQQAAFFQKMESPIFK